MSRICLFQFSSFSSVLDVSEKGIVAYGAFTVYNIWLKLHRCMGHIKWKSTIEHAQNVQIQIILSMSEVSAGPLLSIHTSWFPMILLVDSEA